MKTIIAGSRNGVKLEDVLYAIHRCGWFITSVVSGTARGADQMGEIAAKNMCLQVHKFPADWDRYGKSAGYKRNVQMAENADALIAIWDGKSRRTQSMIKIAKDRGLPVYVYNLGELDAE